VSIHEADMYLVFFNGLTMDIDSGLVISVYDNDLGKWVGDFEFNQTIPAGSNVQSSMVPLDGQQLSNTFILQYSIPIKGTDGELYEITQADIESNFTTEVHITGMDVKHVIGEVPEQTEVRYDASALDSEDKEVISAQIESGIVNLTVTNNVAVSADIEIKILSIVDENDQPLTKTETVYADSVSQFSLDLSQYRIVNYPNQGTNIPLDSIHYEVTVTSIPTGDNESSMSRFLHLLTM